MSDQTKPLRVAAMAFLLAEHHLGDGDDLGEWARIVYDDLKDKPAIVALAEQLRNHANGG